MGTATDRQEIELHTIGKIGNIAFVVYGHKQIIVYGLFEISYLYSVSNGLGSCVNCSLFTLYLLTWFFKRNSYWYFPSCLDADMEREVEIHQGLVYPTQSVPWIADGDFGNIFNGDLGRAKQTAKASALWISSV